MRDAPSAAQYSRHSSYQIGSDGMGMDDVYFLSPYERDGFEQRQGNISLGSHGDGKISQFGFFKLAPEQSVRKTENGGGDASGIETFCQCKNHLLRAPEMFSLDYMKNSHGSHWLLYS
jgi:hypothetical protein